MRPMLPGALVGLVATIFTVFAFWFVTISDQKPTSAPDAGTVHIGDRFALTNDDANLYRADMSMKTVNRYIFSPTLPEGTVICLDGNQCSHWVERMDAGWTMKRSREDEE